MPTSGSRRSSSPSASARCRGAGRLRHAGRDHGRDDDGARVRAAEGGRGRADRQHCTGRVRRALPPRSSRSPRRVGPGDPVDVDTLGADGRPANALSYRHRCRWSWCWSSTAPRLRRTWLPALVAGLAFSSRSSSPPTISVALADIVASLVSAAAVVAAAPGLVAGGAPRVRAGRRLRPALNHRTSPRLATGPRLAPPGWAPAYVRVRAGPVRSAVGTRPQVDSRGDVVRAVRRRSSSRSSITNITAVKEALAKEPTSLFSWPGLRGSQSGGRGGRDDELHLELASPAAGTLMIVAGAITALILRVSPATALRTYGGRTSSPVGDRDGDGGAGPGLRDEPVRADVVVGGLAGWRRRCPRPDLACPGWIGVGSPARPSQRAFGGLAGRRSASRADLLLAAANTLRRRARQDGQLQNLAIAAAAVGMAGREGDPAQVLAGASCSWS